MTTTDRRTPRPVVLCILDGWGYREEREHNAIAQANTPVYDGLWNSCPRAWIKTSGLAVGLPDGQMGNSEVGHMNLGGGRVILQDLPRIDDAIVSGALAADPTLGAHIAHLKVTGGTCHLLGLLSPGGVHSHQDHMVALARIVSHAGVPVRIHAFLDGRDTPPKSALVYLDQFEAGIADLPNTAIATVSGRYYAMDRDKRWDRVEKAYNVIIDGEGEGLRVLTARAAVEQSYATDKADEFVLPTAIGGYTGAQDGDGILMANFRADRAREILTVLLDPIFDGFIRKRVVSFATTTGMVEYSAALNPYLTTIFQPLDIRNSLGEVISNAGLRQLRTAETEKYAHVTFFFNGGAETVFPGEDRILVPSPKVATYDLQPEMSAFEVTDNLVRVINDETYDLIVVNYANPDMVGHTGIMSAAIKAAETVDTCVGRLRDAILKVGGTMIVTADHGNLEMMLDTGNGQAYTQHTTFDVPALLVNAPNTDITLQDGRLADIAPTILALMGIKQPADMTGVSLLGSRDQETLHVRRAGSL